MLIQWNESLSVKVAEIDRQHRDLIGMINDLTLAMSEGKGRTVVGKIVDGLVSYTDTHFRTEERYFDAFDYPDAYNHKKEHDAFVAKVTEFRDGIAHGKIALSIEVMNFLSDWLRNHISVTDRKYALFFRDKGVQ